MLFLPYFVAVGLCQGYLHLPFEKRERLSKRDEVYSSLNKTEANDSYVLTLKIGSEEQEIQFILDTGSSDLWVASSSNPYCDEMDCSNTFNSEDSTTYKDNGTEFYVSYLDHSFASGVFAQDSVTIGDFTLSNVNFGFANITNITEPILGVGLEHQEGSFIGNLAVLNGYSYTYANFPTQLVQQNVISKRVYSLSLDTQEYGSILFGGVDNAKYDGNLTLVPIVKTITNEAYTGTEVTISGVKLSNNETEVELLDDVNYILLDSGTTITRFSTDLFFNLVEYLDLQENNGTYYSNCSLDSDLSLTLDFQGFEYEFPVSSIFDDECTLQIFYDDDFIIGQDLLNDLYVVYDLDDLQLALALANHSEDEDIEVITSEIPNATSAAGYFETYVVTEDSSSSSSTASSTASSSSDSSSKSGAASLRVDSYLKTLFTVLAVGVLLL